MVTYVKSLNKNPLWGLGWQTELPWPKLDELHSAAIDPTKLDLAKHLQSTHACMDPYLCICVCMYVCTYVCMCLFISIYIYIHILIDIPPYATAMMHMPCRVLVLLAVPTDSPIAFLSLKLFSSR